MRPNMNTETSALSRLARKPCRTCGGSGDYGYYEQDGLASVNEVIIPCPDCLDPATGRPSGLAYAWLSRLCPCASHTEPYNDDTANFIYALCGSKCHCCSGTGRQPLRRPEALEAVVTSGKFWVAGPQGPKDRYFAAPLNRMTVMAEGDTLLEALLAAVEAGE